MMRRPKLTALVLGLVSATGFAPLEWWLVTLAAFAGLVLFVAQAENWRGAFARSYFFGFGHFVVGLNWIAGAFRYQDAMPVWFGWGAVVALSFYLAVYPAFGGALAWRLTRSKPGIGLPFALAFAGAWAGTEYFRATLFTGFAWNPLAVILVPTQADGLARLVGTYGLSALTALLAASIAVAIRHWQRVPFAIALAGIMFGCGWLLAPGITADAGRAVRVVQPNIGQQNKHDPRYDEINFQRLVRLSGKPEERPRLLLWPEAAVPYFLEEERWARERIARLMGPRDIILTGADALVYGADGKLVAARNSVFAMDARARLLSRYDKAHLVPYGEYLPMRPVLSAIGLSRLVPGDLDFLAGPGARTLTVPGFGKVGLQICYEIIFSGQVVDARDRPDVLFNPSNDAWFGAWGPPQHLAQARLRAIEEAMPVVRSTPTGISAVIDAHGALKVTLPLGKAGFIATTLPAPQPPTLFARFGNALALGFAGAMLLAGVALSQRQG